MSMLLNKSVTEDTVKYFSHHTHSTQHSVNSLCIVIMRLEQAANL